MSALPHPYWTPEEYFALEKASQHKNEYLDGQIYAMAGASPTHDTITGNAYASLHQQVRGSECKAYTSDIRVKAAGTAYFYPDTSIICGEPFFTKIQGLDVLVNPTLIIEALSPSTERFDRGNKFSRYRAIDSLQEYVMISQDKAQIERYTRQPNGDWLLTVVEGLDKQIALQSVGCTLTLADVYETVTFDTSDADPI